MAEAEISRRKLSLTLLAGMRWVQPHGRECASQGVSGLCGPQIHMPFDPATQFLESPPHACDAMWSETRDNLHVLPGAAKCTVAHPHWECDAAFPKTVASRRSSKAQSTKEANQIQCN